ncbi:MULTISPECIES: sulfite exporter TauE/SafE family protein [Chitinibacter]|uniref:sulfite exporter TauE/SafE family protein n=1 Tax=Chitinibacter TaxID=230666 RepID=UPI000B340E53|nr:MULTISPECIES: sulfite exporter TauE/SafE family protein [Chitinibacter]
MLASALIFLAALLYSSVGHGGASGYLAVMALLGFAPEVMKPAALALNVLVAGLASWKFIRAGAFSRPIFIPLVIASVPMAALGGAMHLPGNSYRVLLGVVLIAAAAWSVFRLQLNQVHPARPAPQAALLLAGASIGLISGLTGVGGGIFLSPLLLITGWASIRCTAGISAAFILFNSLAGLAGLWFKGSHFPVELPWWALAAGLGGWIGAELGARHLTSTALRSLLSLVLLIAGGKMLLT